MALGAVIARILTQYSDKGSKAAAKDIAKLGDKFDAFSRTAVRSFGIAAAAAGAFAVKFASDSVNAALEAQSSQNRLRKLLLTTNGATEEQIVALNEQAAALERVGVVTAGNVTVVQSQLATFDLYGKTINTLTPAILDYVTAEKGAGASADQFKQMTNGLAQALNGNFGSLTRTGFVLDDNTKKMISTGTETERAAAIVKVLESTYKGFNESLRDTDEGSIQSLKNAMNALKQTVGTALLPVVRKFTDLLQNDLLPKISAWVELNQAKLVASFEKAAYAAYDLFVIAVKIGNWVVNNIETVKKLAAAFAVLWATGKVIAFANAINTVTKAIIGLKAAGGLGLIGPMGKAAAKKGPLLTLGAALAAGSVGNKIGKKLAEMTPGTTAYKEKAAKEQAMIKAKAQDKLMRGNNPMSPSATDLLNGFAKKSTGKDPFAEALDDNTTAVKKNTKSIMDVATENAMKELAARQKALSGSASIAIGGGGKIYSVRDSKGNINVNLYAGNVVGSADDLIQTVQAGLEVAKRRSGGGPGSNRYAAMVAV
jgi:hypothetical protein